MATIAKAFGVILVGLGAAVALLSVFGPREDGTLDYVFLPDRFEGDVDAYFATQEARFDDITPGTEKRVIWAGEAGVKTPLSVVYVHGFSATSEEIRPLPDRLAQALGANLIYTRLTGHGRSGEALAQATVQDWTRDTAEAIEAGRMVGDQVIVMGTSTGATLLAGAITRAPTLTDDIKAAILISPNFGVNNPSAPLLNWPAARYWITWVAGERRRFEPANEGQATYWTHEYPTVAVLPMSALVQSVVALDFETALVDALFWYAPDDQVVRADETDRIARIWNRGFASATVVHPELTDADDPYAHVIAGDILSPAQTAPATAAMLNWIEGLD